MSNSENERDEFWDLDKLVPKKKPSVSPFKTVSQVTDHIVGGTSSSSDGERKLTFGAVQSKGRTEEQAYTPEHSGLIKKITIKRFVDKYDFYGNFRKAALIYYDYKMPKCEFTPFYSYMPQYTQLTAPQKNYYFYWRDEIRRGRHIKCDYSYLYLYVYEILNLPDKISPNEGIRLLCRLWREYRSELPRIDAYFSVWIQDYCFIYNLPCPMEDIREFVFDVIATSDFKEFYLSDMNGAGSDGAEAMIAYLSDYDWRRSKYAEGNDAEIFRNHMVGAMRILISEYMSSGHNISTDEVSVLRRDAFPHSLCTHAVKCKLEIEYVSLAKDEELRRAITAGVRYTENKLRALIGVKSRLGIKDLPDIARRIIDRYFDNIFEMERIRRERECAPEYEKLYDAETKALSFADADEIERASWTTTARLVVEEDADEEDTAEESNSQSTVDTCDNKADSSLDDATAKTDESSDRSLGLSDGDIALIGLLIEGEAAVPDDAFERINEAFLASDIGDIILEHDGEKYVIIEDYRQDIEEWFSGLN